MKLTLAGAVVATAVLVAVPGAAFADSFSHSDPAKDVQQLSFKGHSQTSTLVPTRKSGDVVHFAASYNSKQLTESVRVRALSGTWIDETRIQTPSARFDVSVPHHGSKTSVVLTKGKAGTPQKCTGLSRTVSPKTGVISVHVPADCLGSPSWVQVGNGIVAFTKNGGLYEDDALRKAGSQESDLTLSKRLRK